jgi:hypothetical protein
VIYLGLVMCGVFGALLVVMLVTGRAFNPLRGATPMIVTRGAQPGRYWTSVVLWSAFIALVAWICFTPSANSN